MYYSAPGCDQSRLVLDPDDKTGAETLYPCSANAQCNDGLLCTNDVCTNKKCIRTDIANCCTANTQCGDGNACTTDKCSSNACTHTDIAGCTEPDGGEPDGSVEDGGTDGGVLGEPPNPDAQADGSAPLDGGLQPDANTPNADAGVEADAGVGADARPAPQAADVESGEGCACSTQPRRTSGMGALLVMVAAAGLFSRRRGRSIASRRPLNL